MATRGRKPKPTAVKVLEGNPGKRPLNMFEPVPDKVAPECPSWLNDEAKAEFMKLYQSDAVEYKGLYPTEINFNWEEIQSNNIPIINYNEGK